MLGGTLWADWHPGKVPAFMNGIGLEIEARDISFNNNSTRPSNFRTDTAGGGPFFSWQQHRDFRPYGKFLIQFGSVDFRSGTPTHSHDTRTLLIPGGSNIASSAMFGHEWIMNISSGWRSSAVQQPKIPKVSRLAPYTISGTPVGSELGYDSLAHAGCARLLYRSVKVKVDGVGSAFSGVGGHAGAAVRGSLQKKFTSVLQKRRILSCPPVHRLWFI